MQKSKQYELPVTARMASVTSQSPTGEWQHGLCGCFDNAGLCIMAFCCPAFVFSQNAKHVGEDCLKMGICCMLPPFHVAAHVAIRGKIRERREIQGSVFQDIVVATFCPFCALVQDTLEVHDMLGLTGDDDQPGQPSSIVRI